MFQSAEWMASTRIYNAHDSRAMTDYLAALAPLRAPVPDSPTGCRSMLGELGKLPPLTDPRHRQLFDQHRRQHERMYALWKRALEDIESGQDADCVLQALDADLSAIPSL